MNAIKIQIKDTNGNQNLRLGGVIDRIRAMSFMIRTLTHQLESMNDRVDIITYREH